MASIHDLEFCSNALFEFKITCELPRDSTWEVGEQGAGRPLVTHEKMSVCNKNRFECAGCMREFLFDHAMCESCGQPFCPDCSTWWNDDSGEQCCFGWRERRQLPPCAIVDKLMFSDAAICFASQRIFWLCRLCSLAIAGSFPAPWLCHDSSMCRW